MKLLWGFFIALVLGLSSASAQEPLHSIENIAGDLYRFQSDNYYGVFLVTDEGIILADPINTETATWLKGELDRRFAQPVKYVIYSHDHADHTSGGEVFEGTATFVAHTYAKPKFEEDPHGPIPTLRFPYRYQIHLGGKTVDLYFFGASHTNNLITIGFPEERAIYLVDAAAVKRLPYRDLEDWYFPWAINYLESVLTLDFDIFIPGHGPVGVKDDIRDHRDYLIVLFEQVRKARLAGLSEDETVEKVNLEAFFEWDMYNEWRELNIRGMYRILGETKLVAVPEEIDHVPPLFPANALQMRFVGWVIVKYDVDAEGRTQNITVFDSGAESLLRGVKNNTRARRQFEKAAIRATSKTKFEPGIPIEGLFRWENFRLPEGAGEFDPFQFNQEVGKSSFGNFDKFMEDNIRSRYRPTSCC